MTNLKDNCRALVEALGLGQAKDVSNITPLTGGVASDIARLQVGGRTLCAKFALPKLKVAEEWYAPVHRNAAEYAWLEVAAMILPNSAVRLFGRSQDLHGFAMEFLEGDDVYLWKSALLDEAPEQDEAGAVGAMIGAIHQASARDGFDVSPFQNRDDFRALRIEPYLIFTAGRQPEIADQLHALADMLYESTQVLVHGDVSPKNILFRKSGPVVLDAECATMGDASFDPAFCLNHLVLKAIHLANSRDRLFASVAGFWADYKPHVTWEPAADLEARICRLLPALMLARVDGKSPVEYLDQDEKDVVRRLSIRLINAPQTTLSGFIEQVSSQLKDTIA